MISKDHERQTRVFERALFVNTVLQDALEPLACAQQVFLPLSSPALELQVSVVVYALIIYFLMKSLAFVSELEPFLETKLSVINGSKGRCNLLLRMV